MRRMTLAIVALFLALTGCATTSKSTSTLARSGGLGPGGTGLGTGSAVHLIEGALVRFDACDDFLRHVKAEAIERVGPYGLEWYGDRPWLGFPMEAVAMAAPTAEMEAGGRDVAAVDEDFSQTNNQETGVDEADIVKTDGKRIVTIVNGRLIVVDVAGRKPVVTGTLELAPEQHVSEMFLHGDTVVLLGSSWGPVHPLPVDVGIDMMGVVAPDYYPGSPIVTITAVDIAADPEVVSVLQIDGASISSRLIDDVARVVLTSGPTGFVWAYPEGNGLRAERAAIAANKEIIEESTIENWVPYYVLSDGAGRVLDEGPAVACSRAHHPAEFAGFNMLSILSFDLDEGLEIVDSTGVLASGETVYSSQNAMYVATNDWFDMQVLEGDVIDIEAEFSGARTQIHQFDISGSATRYVATGAVPGYLLNQFAMSEHNGDLRVASTTAPDWWGRGGQQESMVSVLRPDDGELELIGRVDGLGKDEQIYSVRFHGDVAYVVTFRQIDPLFTIDLRDPRNPEVRGELKIPGYSAYLHPIGDGLVLGIGQDATREGQIRGSQVSLFDVSDLDFPERVDKLGLGRDSNSTAEYDHKAFLHWDDIVVLPITEYGWRDGKDDFHTGAVVVQIDGDRLHELTRITHPGAHDWDHGWNATIQRSLVVGDSLYTISSAGILESDLVDFDDVAWLDFSEV